MDALLGVEVKIIAYFLGFLQLLFMGLLLAGCISNSAGIPNLHIIQLNGGESTLVRIGYYGICVLDKSDTFCIPSGFVSQNTTLQRLSQTARDASLPSNTTENAIKVQENFLNVLAIAVSLLLLALILDLLRIHNTKRTRKQPITQPSKRRRNFYRQFSLALAWGACALTLSAAVANTQMIHELQLMSGNMVHVGTASLALHWTTWAISVIFCSAWTMLRRSRSSFNNKPGMPESTSFTAPLAAQGTPMAVVSI